MPPVPSAEPGLWKVLKEMVTDYKNVHQSLGCLQWWDQIIPANIDFLLSFKNDHSTFFYYSLGKKARSKKNIPFISDRMYLFGVLRDSFSAYYVYI